MSTDAPSTETYNRTFGVLENARSYLAVADTREHLRALVEALERAFISTWQSTAAWQKELDAAREYLNSTDGVALPDGSKEGHSP